MRKIKLFITGIGIGIINSLFGAGGGIIAVPILRSEGLNQRQAQASAIAVILPLSFISTVMYLIKGYFTLSDGLWFIPFGLTGAVLGTKIMKKVSNRLLNTLFSILMLYMGIRMILK